MKEILRFINSTHWFILRFIFHCSIATIGNVGPGFGDVSSLGNYGNLPVAAKYVLSANMLLGRLEIMNVFALFLLLCRKD